MQAFSLYVLNSFEEKLTYICIFHNVLTPISPCHSCMVHCIAADGLAMKETLPNAFIYTISKKLAFNFAQTSAILIIIALDNSFVLK